MNLAVIDTLKKEDKPNDRHSSKNISIPLNPGLLITLLNDKPISEKTKTIRVKVLAEPGFDPMNDMDISSLRFGASTAVNFGRGRKVVKPEKAKDGLTLTFDGKGNEMTHEEFAPKMIGKTKQGKMLYEFSRVLWMNYNEPILSARKPLFIKGSNKTDIKVNVENFGQVSSGKARLRLDYVENKKLLNLGEATIAPLLPFAAKELLFSSPMAFEKNREYDFVLTVTSGNNKSRFNFKEKF